MSCTNWTMLTAKDQKKYINLLLKVESKTLDKHNKKKKHKLCLMDEESTNCSKRSNFRGKFNFQPYAAGAKGGTQVKGSCKY